MSYVCSHNNHYSIQNIINNNMFQSLDISINYNKYVQRQTPNINS